MKSCSVLLPKSGNSQTITEVTDVRSMVIVGANGAGKSRLGHWMEYNQVEEQFVHRVSAQRVAQMDSEVWPQDYEEAERYLLFGNSSNKRKAKKDPKYGRWGDEPVTGMAWDFDSVLSLLYAEEDKRNREYVAQVKISKRKVKLPASSLDVLKEIWQELFTQRKIDLVGNKFIASTEQGEEYSASELSDGERITFYLLGQCLLAPSNSIVIIDEPEIHIHRSLQNSLWNKIEALREDCCFVYLTHDLDFAAHRNTSAKIWLRSFDGNSWDWEKVPQTEQLSEEIVLEIIGSRKPVLFVEGERNKNDHKIYQAIYSNYLVIPRGSCVKVIESTRALRSNPSFHHLDARGLIDRDYRTDEELASLKASGIEAINVAEVENLYCTEGLIKLVAESLELDPTLAFENVKAFIFKEFQKELEAQASKKSSFDIKFKLNLFNDNAVGVEGLSNHFKTVTESIDIQSIYQRYYKEFSDYIENGDYEGVLRSFNRKSLSSRVSRFLDLDKGKYPELILRYIHSSRRSEIIKELSRYTPEL
ncbi:DUF4435 domain-containing protein [Pseudoalteromonas xiamenensis]|uniref:DUF4435 domain-containing protein n=1 Tax=Pseudoalteromonas xiamenensis TaxID=882626 RepID=UPI0027E3C348|nr:DUF4435 domain-containing protein [Pseudoalteromonas xiamenensis]WMN59553.1 DUF4435 domain-containing protein [Pseudoalteromonas xiamenensis]